MLARLIESDGWLDRSQTSMKPWSFSLIIWLKRCRFEYWIETEYPNRWLYVHGRRLGKAARMLLVA